MSDQQMHHYMTDHIWRALRALILSIAALIWLYQDGFTLSDGFIMFLFLCAHLLEQFHGKICNMIEHMLNWKEDFDDWD